MRLPRIAPGQVPDAWIWFGVIKFMFRLPSYGYHYFVEWDRDEWCQLVILWHGWYGFRTRWMRDTKLGAAGING